MTELLLRIVITLSAALLAAAIMHVLPGVTA